MFSKRLSTFRPVLDVLLRKRSVIGHNVAKLQHKAKISMLAPTYSILKTIRHLHTTREVLEKEMKLETPLVKQYIDHLVSQYNKSELSLASSGGDKLVDGRRATDLLHKLKPLVLFVNEYHQTKKQMDELTHMEKEMGAEDQELRLMAVREKEECLNTLHQLEDKIMSLLVPVEAADHSDIILEVSAGVGGQEAMLFTEEIFNMYNYFAQYKGWQMEVISEGETEQGLRSASASICGQNVYEYMKFEAGIHRVQRVPKTEKTGRVHTSTMSVVVLPQPSEIDIQIHQKDLKIDTFRASGAGGQHVNTTDSAVRITHIPTGTVVECQAGRSQIKNKELATKILLSKLYEKKMEEQTSKIKSQRKLQAGLKMRSDKIRTYNFNQDRITDHRIGKNMFNLSNFLSGGEELEEMIMALLEESAKERLVEILQEFDNMSPKNK